MFLFFSMLLLCSLFRLKEVNSRKNSLITSFLFFLNMPKIGVVRTTLNGEKNEDGLMAAILIFKCTEGAGVWIAVGRRGREK